MIENFLKHQKGEKELLTFQRASELVVLTPPLSLPQGKTNFSAQTATFHPFSSDYSNCDNRVSPVLLSVAGRVK